MVLSDRSGGTINVHQGGAMLMVLPSAVHQNRKYVVIDHAFCNLLARSAAISHMACFPVSMSCNTK